MKKLTLSILVACTLCVATAIAQMAPGSAGQGTQSSPSTRQQQPGMGQPDQNAPMGQDQTTNNSNTSNAEHTVKGCVQSQGGQYVLETKKGKDIALAGQDVSAHVGHEVALKGTWEKGAMSQSSTGAKEKTLNVTDVKMISDSCSAGKKGKSSDMGSSGTMGNGSNPAGTTPNSQGSTGTGTQPPQ